MGRHPRITGIACAMAAGLLAGPIASAQQRSGLENVTVWAQKRPASLQNVPMPLTTLDGRELATAGINSLAGVADVTPALDMQRSVGPVTTTLRIRRVGNLGNIPTFEPAVGLFVDGAFRSRSLLGTADLLDVERIEVLSGPQSSLYGKSSSAGVVAIYTRKPGEELTGQAEITAGSIDAAHEAATGTARMDLSGPLTQRLRAGITAAYSGHDHTLVNALPGAPDGNDQARTTLRGQLLWQPTAQLELRLIAGHLRESDDQGESDVFLAPGAASTAIAAALQSIGGQPCPDNAPHDRTTCAVATNTLDLEATDITLIGSYEFRNGWQLTSTTAWDHYRDRRDEDDLVQLYAPLLFFHDSETGTTVQEELRLTSADSARIRWLAGLFYYRNEYRRGENGERPMFGPNGPAAFDALWPRILGGLPLALPGQEGIHASSVDTDYYSVFGQVDWPLTDRLSLSTAVRWQAEEKHATIDNSLSAPGASVISVMLTPSTSPGGEPVNGRMQRSTDYLTWAVTPTYRFSDTLMTYLTIAREGKSGGFNTGFGNAPQSAREFGDESIEHYELGTRALFADGRVRLGTSAFRTRYRDYQDAAFIASQFSVGNVSRVDLRGAELDGDVLLGAGTTASLGVSYADLTYRDHSTGMCYPGRTPDGSLPGSCNLSGEHPIDAPEWVINAGLQHTHPTHWGRWFGRIDWSWTDRYNTSFSADPRLIQQAHHDLALRLGAGFGDNLEVALWGRHLLNDKVVHIDAVLNLFNDASYQSFLADPRTYGVTMRGRF